MVKPDVIVCNPYGIDYPLWRYEMEKERSRFNEIIIGMYDDHRQYNFLEFIREAMPKGSMLVDAGDISGGKDWRDATVNKCLDFVNSEWVLFIEQDFIPNAGFWDMVFEKQEHCDLIGYGDMGTWSADVRLHPAFIMVKTELINKTRKDFGAHPDKNRDHFATFTEDLFNLGSEVNFFSIEHYEGTLWEHRKGLTSNYNLVLAGQKPNYEPDKFREYVKLAMEAPVEQDPRFLEWSKRCLMSTNK